MDFNQFVKLLELFIAILQTLIWPVIVLLILFYLRKPLIKFLNDLSEVNVKCSPA